MRTNSHRLIELKCCFWVLLFNLFSNSMHTQTYMMAGVRGSTLVSPKVEWQSNSFGLGGTFKMDWVNKLTRHRIFEISYDKLELIVDSDQASTNSVDKYSLSFVKMGYGWRAFLAEKEQGLYLEAGLGLFFSKVDGTNSRELNEVIGITGVFTPCFGYCISIFDLGVECMIAPARNGVVVSPVAHLGLRLNAKPDKKTPE